MVVKAIPMERPVDGDAELMLSAAKGDSSAFAKLYRKYLPLVHLYLKRLGCQTSSVPDLAQEVFTRLWVRRRQYAGESTFKTYVLGYANKVFLEEQRHLRRDRALADHFSEGLSRTKTTSRRPDPGSAHDELKESLDRAIARLPARQQEAI
jgi:RNA polymerase sigma factor (sigma-70 family)